MIDKLQVQIMCDINYILSHYNNKTYIPFEWLNKLVEIDYGYYDNRLIQSSGFRYESIDEIDVPIDEMAARFKIFTIDAFDKIYKLTLAIRDNKVVDYWMTLEETE